MAATRALALRASSAPRPGRPTASAARVAHVCHALLNQGEIGKSLINSHS